MESFFYSQTPAKHALRNELNNINAWNVARMLLT